MRDIFDLLGASSEEGAEELTKVFRKAAEARRDAQAQLDALNRACAIPRDTDEEASRPREFERQPLRPEPRHTVFMSDTVAVLALGFGVVFLLLANALMEPNDGAKVAEVTTRPPVIATVQAPVPTGATEPEKPPRKLEGAVVPSIVLVPSEAIGVAENGDVAGTTENGPAPRLPGSGVEVAKVTEDTRAALDQPDVKTSTNELEKSARIEPPGQNENQDMAGALSTTATVQAPVPTGTSEQEEQPGKLEGAVVPSIALVPSTATGTAENGDEAANAKNAPTRSLPGSGIEVAKVTEDTRAALDQTDVKTGTDELKKSEGIDRPNQNHNRVRSAGVGLSSLEKNKSAPHSSSSDFVVSNKRQRMKTPNTETHGKPQAVAIRQIQNHAPSACSDSAFCPSRVSLLLGVAF